MAEALKQERTWVQVMVGVLAAFGVVALLAWVRNDPGIADREADPEDVVVVVHPAPPEDG
jgi:hypothetical protein